MDLSRFPRLTLAHLPTPLEELPRLAASLGLPRMLVKRDDCTGLALGGNKTRKLEFALGDALAKGADVIVTSGGFQSNHVRQTAAACARLGLTCEAVVANPLRGSDVGESARYGASGNLLLDRLLGATVHIGGDEVVAARLDALRAAGARPYLVPIGASNGVGALGYVDGARELTEQCRARGFEPSHVFVGTGSAGTHAGLLMGLALAGSAARVIGVAVSEDEAAKVAKVQRVLDELVVVLGLEASPLDADAIVVHGAYTGPGYAVRTREADAALARLARTEGLVLDPVYTAKAMAGMLDLLERGALGDVRDPVFLHTGGSPALFAYPTEGEV